MRTRGGPKPHRAFERGRVARVACDYDEVESGVTVVLPSLL